MIADGSVTTVTEPATQELPTQKETRLTVARGDRASARRGAYTDRCSI